MSADANLGAAEIVPAEDRAFIEVVGLLRKMNEDQRRRMLAAALAFFGYVKVIEKIFE